MTFRTIVLWLFVLNLGVAFGAGLYETLVEFPHWLVNSNGIYTWNAEAARSANSGLRFWAFFTTGPLTLLALLNLVASWKMKGTLRRWWVASVHSTIVERAITFSFFVPTMIYLMQSASTPETIASALLWEKLNYLRHFLNLFAWIAALNAFRLQAKE